MHLSRRDLAYENLGKVSIETTAERFRSTPGMSGVASLEYTTDLNEVDADHDSSLDPAEGHVHSNAKLDGVSSFFDQPLVFIVRTDPEPNHFITFDRADGTVVSCDPRR